MGVSTRTFQSARFNVDVSKYAGLECQNVSFKVGVSKLAFQHARFKVGASKFASDCGLLNVGVFEFGVSKLAFQNRFFKICVAKWAFQTTRSEVGVFKWVSGVGVPKATYQRGHFNAGI